MVNDSKIEEEMEIRKVNRGRSGSLLNRLLNDSKRRQGYHKIGYIFICFGAILIVIALINDLSLSALAGLSLTSMGGLLLFWRTHEYIQRELLDSIVISSLVNIQRIFNNIKTGEKAIHLPPRLLEGFKDLVLFVPTKEQLKQQEEAIKDEAATNPHGIFITPSGQGLLTLYEKKLGTDFSRTSLSNLEKNLNKVLVEDLEILELIEVDLQENMIDILMRGPIVAKTCNEIRMKTDVCSTIGCPFCSSIACVLAKVTDKAIIIESSEVLLNRNIIYIRYILIDANQKRYWAIMKNLAEMKK